MKKQLKELLGSRVQYDVSLKMMTSFQIGGNAACYALVETIDELQALIAVAAANEVKWKVIGRGSNLVIEDSGFDGIIIHLRGRFCEINAESTPLGVRLTAGAGVSLTALVKYCQQKGYGGIEFLFGIPGSLGGAVIMNAGAWGHELAVLVRKVSIVTRDGLIPVEREKLNFTYRSWPQWKEYAETGVVGSVVLHLDQADPLFISAKCKENVRKRMETQPKGMPNAGSFFKNPEGDSAGRLIDACNLKGLQVGGAMVSTVHANFFVNDGSATAADVKQLMQIVQEKVHTKYGVMLQPEVHFI